LPIVTSLRLQREIGSNPTNSNCFNDTFAADVLNYALKGKQKGLKK